VSNADTRAAIAAFVREFPHLHGLVHAPLFAALFISGAGKTTGVFARNGLEGAELLLLALGFGGFFVVRRYYRRRFGSIKPSPSMLPEAPGGTPIVARHLAIALAFVGLVLFFVGQRRFVDPLMLTFGSGFVIAGTGGSRVRWHWLFVGGLVFVAAFWRMLQIPLDPAIFLGGVSLLCLIACVIDHVALVRRFEDMRATLALDGRTHA
jgi:hypothetical protein